MSKQRITQKVMRGVTADLLTPKLTRALINLPRFPIFCVQG
jgi:hypothetical protein